MSNLRYIMLLVSVLMLSCSKSEDSSVRDTLWKVEGSVGYDQMTKVGVNGNNLYWQRGDQVAMRAFGTSAVSDQTALTLNLVDSGLPVAKFRGEVSMTERPERCVFAYPSSASIGSDGSVVFDYSAQDGTHNPFLYGSVSYNQDGMECVLQHAGSLIRLFVPEGVTTVQVSGNNGENISKVKVASDGTVTVTEDALASFEVNVESGSVNYIYVPALNLERGFALICSHETKGKLIRSYSTDGGEDSGYKFEQGKVLDIDLSSAPDGDYFKAWCTVEAAHTYKADADKTLTGTLANVTAFGFSGAPAKVIDQWGVALYDGETIVRWAYGGGLFVDSPNYAGGKVPMAVTDYDGSWPLLVPGKVYTAHAICEINGVTMDFEMDQKVSVGHPDIKVTNVSGKTSWTYYEDGSEAANLKDNDAIFEVSASVNVDKDILDNSNYDFKVTFSTDGSSVGKTYDLSSKFTTPALELVWDGLAWGARTVDASVSFAGQSYSSQTSGKTATCQVTGLPYEADWSKQDYNEWNIIGDGAQDVGTCIEFDASGVSIFGSAKSAGLISPEFKIDSEAKVVTQINAASKNVSSWGDDIKYRNFYITSGNKNSEVINLGSSISANYYESALSSVTSTQAANLGYADGSVTCTLTTSNPCLVYSTESKTHNKAVHKIKIEYAF